MPWPIAFILTAAVQAILVIATYQLSNMYSAAAPRRYLAVAAGLTAAFAVSAFFSYFTFYSYNQGRQVSLRKLGKSRTEIDTYIHRVLDARSTFIKGQKELVDHLNQEAQDAREGRLGGERIRLGEGPMAKSRQNLADKAARELEQELAGGELEALANATTEALGLLNKEDAVLDEKKQSAMRDHLDEFERRATKWLTSHGVAQVNAPRLPPLSEYQLVRPSLGDLSEFSPVAFSLAVLVDLFTVLLTWWLESVPFGDLSQDHIPAARSALFAFSNYQINRNNQLEFSLARTNEERYEGVSDGPRKYWAARLLNLGLLRRVDKDNTEFTPRLYTVLDRAAGDDNGNTNTTAK